MINLQLKFQLIKNEAEEQKPPRYHRWPMVA